MARMLLNFGFANHRSFRDEQNLQLTPIYTSDDEVDDAKSLAGVRTVGIFGANASGKSNVLHALTYVRQLALRSDRDVEPGLAGIARHPFRLDHDSGQRPSSYVVDLSLDGVLHSYGFVVADDAVVEEWLYHYPLKKKRNVFERCGTDYKWGEESGKRDELEKIAAITAPTALFLSTVARFDQRRSLAGPQHADPLHDVYRWFYRFRIGSQGGPRRVPFWPDMPRDREVVVALIQAADVGITDVTLMNPAQDAPLSKAELEATATNPALSRTIRDLLAQRERDRSGDRELLQFAHRGPHGDVLFGLEDESTGTRQLMDLAIDAAAILRTSGTMMVDEIDASLHPMLTAKLIRLFQGRRTNPRGCQLLFTSHDATLLGNFDAEEVLHRDQIWFTEKDGTGASTLYPLSDFKPRREGENRQRRYLHGNYGGIPELNADVFEQALGARGEFDAEES